ncbi:MAG TPA: nitrite/sulfite reductase [Chitinophagales bacterium]|nr:nitrite/sulfite reductase [Chitinophagales bacterium]HQD11559.1 nitrite/sulfite reductase [Chitinophagales bacterium]
MSIIITKNISPEAAKDIFELQQKINAFQNGEMPEDKFKAFRLTRGVYGQRQLGVQMFRTKFPFGKITPKQLVRVAELSEQYASANLHLTTRQNIQLHYVKVTDAPAIWAGLEDVGATGREACGNTVRNITASSKAGIDPDELFDVSPYAQAAFEFFLRNPICQDMGRKIKPAFSSSDKDSAYTFLHDFGFIPRIQDGQRGFKVVVGGGLGAQAILAQTAYEFLHEDQIIPFMEAALRVFDRYGERTRRHKARMKFLIKEMGLEKFMELVETERKANKVKTFKIDTTTVVVEEPAHNNIAPSVEIADVKRFEDWKKTNVFEQKQKGYFAVALKVTKGDVKPDQARKIAEIATNYASEDMRITMNQGLLLKFVREDSLPYIYTELDKMGFATPGFDTIADVTTCPGTDTCNLGVTNSMTLGKILEEVILDEFYHLIFESDIKIKISGCMNSCGQHMAAQIGLHGSSIKVGELVAPAMQVVLGGGVDVNGVGFVGDKIVKLPTKKMPAALRTILSDYETNSQEGEYFNDYYRRQGKNYFYTLLKPLANADLYTDDDFIDYDGISHFTPEIGVGECAGVMYDMVGGIIKDAENKLVEAKDHLVRQKYPEAIYYAYTGFIIAAKALLLSKDVECNTQIKILKDFDTHLVATGQFEVEGGFENKVLQINQYEPEQPFAGQYVEEFAQFLKGIIAHREAALNADKIVVESSYKA